VLQRLTVLGYQPGMHPQRKSLGGVHDLTDHVLQAFSAQGPGVRNTRVAAAPP